ncbi:N-acetyldiaminopimelate deacetylase [Shouchella lehensis]|uniref:N-acetyldiaminopimelate deacetylase n=1 Tax=Shouchella lehensis TaxID=300825 RepID=A0A4Y7WQF0_9BACI|nr:N-acetyldiaminopimelate deacetylase [Shouchella lehensis]MBG9784169.1 N-acetyldiaminopimelate deacetylase [Shouchella lehensis]RQW20820.1 N-acetyldiaminopimelate deacetylase [Bacillus sp. C1-1]TES50845.1 N-acetyldiaminopimelate deacetylase [Shouchella lehensis]
MNHEALIQLRRKFHQIPEIGFEEYKTQALILDTVGTLNQERLTVTKWRTGVIVKVDGKSPYTIAYRADMDGLPVQEETNLPYRSLHEGAMHACGHDLHMTIALGMLDYFSENEPPTSLLFVFQPAEEGPGGAKPMLESGVLDKWKPEEMYALHIDPNLPVGTISTKAGLLFANTSELFIDFKGKGGHAAYPHTANDMVVAAAHFVTQLQSIVSRNVDPLDSAVVTIGVINGGTKQNVIASGARVEGTIRTLSMVAMKKVKQRIEALVKGIEVGFSCEATIDYGSNYCEVNNDTALTQAFIDFSEDQPGIQFVHAKEAMTGEDFGYFLKAYPGLMFWLGVDSSFGLHDARLNPHEEAIGIAVKHMCSFFNQKQEG